MGLRHLAVALSVSALQGSALTATDPSVGAVQKVIGMLGEMKAKSIKEKSAEEVAFAEFNTWCSQESASLSSEIGQNGNTIASLDAEIAKLGSNVKVLGEEVAQLQSEVATHSADKEEATKQREKDHSDFIAEQQDYSESVTALEQAIVILKKEDYDREMPAESLLQLTKADSRLPAKAKSIVAAFIGMLDSAAAKEQDPLGGLDYKSPEAHGYEFQSGGIVGMLKKLLDTFREKLSDCQKAEMNSKHAYDMVMQDLTDSVENKNHAIGEKSKLKDQKTEKKAMDEKLLAGEKNMKAANEKTLSEVKTECTEKKFSYQEKQNLRAEEIEAIAKAVEILSSPEVSGNADKHLSLLQARSSGTALAQLKGSAALEGIRRRVRHFLEAEGQRLHSQPLTLLAEKIGADTFGKVKKMIQTLVDRLMVEANEDAKHEGYCDTEMGKSKISRTKLNEEIDSLTATIEDGKATILRLTSETAALTKEVEDLDKAMGEASELRSKDKATNAETVSDAKAAQKAIQAAVGVLKDFYAKAGTATGFLQLKAEPREWGLKSTVKMGSEEWNALANPDLEGTVDTGHKAGMQTFGEVETGQQDEARYGVLSLLEVIQSDFANLQADTEAAEATAAKSYKSFATESDKNKAVKMQKIEMNDSDKAESEAKLHSDTADLKATQDELLAAERYHKNLVPQCIDQGMTFEERTQARAAEIASLKEALSLLGGSAAAAAEA